MQLDLHMNMFYEIDLKAEKFIFLKTKRQCRDASFYEYYNLESNFANCSRKCTPFYFSSLESYGDYNNSLCKTETEFKCAFDEAAAILLDFAEKPCSILYYSGKVTHMYDDMDIYDFQLSNFITFKYKFAYPKLMKVNEEYLIYDTIGMISSIGGTLGMFIGFSFNNTITLIINYLRNSIFFLSAFYSIN